MDMPKLLIADGNEDFRLTLVQALPREFCVHSCGSGLEALALLRTEKFDLLVLDPQLTHLDGITMLETAISEKIRPRVLILTPMLTTYIRYFAQTLGIEYIIQKPCSLTAVVHRVQDLARCPKLPAPSLPQRIEYHLQLLSLPMNLQGYASLLFCLDLMAKNPNQYLTKSVYPPAAKAEHRSSKNVERNIRTVIEADWKQGDPSIWQLYFPGATERPSNGCFLERIARLLLQELEFYQDF